MKILNPFLFAILILNSISTNAFPYKYIQRTPSYLEAYRTYGSPSYHHHTLTTPYPLSQDPFFNLFQLHCNQILSLMQPKDPFVQIIPHGHRGPKPDTKT
uniref:Uncharacterized protein n=1 Tax=Lepeophtheirus salmonis TaxID=72036 RepID=A0A0K2UYF2_LEPSM